MGFKARLAVMDQKASNSKKHIFSSSFLLDGATGRAVTISTGRWYRMDAMGAFKCRPAIYR